MHHPDVSYIVSNSLAYNTAALRNRQGLDVMFWLRASEKSKSQMNSLPETYLVASQAGMVKIKQWWIPSTAPSPPPDIFP